MKNPLSIAGFVFFILALSGCAVSRSDFSALNPGVNYPPAESNAPVYLTTMGVDGQFEEIGYIYVSASNRNGSYYELNEKLRSVARRAGADAVIYVTYGTENAFSIIPFFISIPYDVNTAQGLAVKRK